MTRMLPGIETVEQHQERLREDRDAYRPERCPSCGRAGLHHHGHYERKAPRGQGLAFSLDPFLIPRFFALGVAAPVRDYRPVCPMAFVLKNTCTIFDQKHSNILKY